MFSCDLYIALLTIFNKKKEIQMKQWFVSNILSTDNMQTFKSTPISEREFTVSITMVFIALAIFGILVKAFGA
jgi:hypothetical protein